MGKGIEHPSLSGQTSINLHMPSSPEALRTPSFWVFIKALFHRHDWLNHCSLTIELNLQLLSPPSRCGPGTQSFHPLITWLVFLATSPHLQVFSTSFFINVTRDTYVALHSKLRVLEALCQKWGGGVVGSCLKTKYIFFIINHTITVKYSWIGKLNSVRFSICSKFQEAFF